MNSSSAVSFSAKVHKDVELSSSANSQSHLLDSKLITIASSDVFSYGLMIRSPLFFSIQWNQRQD